MNFLLGENLCDTCHMIFIILTFVFISFLFFKFLIRANNQHNQQYAINTYKLTKVFVGPHFWNSITDYNFWDVTDPSSLKINLVPRFARPGY